MTATKTMMSRQREAAAAGEREGESEVNAVRPDIAEAAADSYGPINQARWTQKMRTGGLWAFQATIFSVTHDMDERRPLFIPLSG